MAIFDGYRAALLGVQDISPEGCRALVVAVEDMRRRLDEWDIQLPPASPLDRAGARLRQVAARQTYGESDEELRSTGAAIRLINDFLYIVSILGADPQEQMVGELRLAIGGVLGDTQLSARAQDIQTQYWFGAWLSHSGLHPGIPARGARRTPDYLITVDTCDIAVEVKRMRSLTALPRYVRDAGAQLRRPRWPGVMAFDVTSCLDGVGESYSVDSGGSIRRRLSGSFSAVAAEIEMFISSRTNVEPLAGLVTLVSYARFMVWDDNPVFSPHLGFLFSSQRYPLACSAIVSDQGAKLERQLLDGVKRVGGDRITLKRVRSPR